MIFGKYISFDFERLFYIIYYFIFWNLLNVYVKRIKENIYFKNIFFDIVSLFFFLRKKKEIKCIVCELLLGFCYIC